MSDVSDYSFRMMCKEHKAALTFTEMVSAAGLAKGDFFAIRTATISPEEHPVALQLLGSNAEILADAAEVAEGNNIDLINLNFGCSVTNVCNLGFGSVLLEDQQKLRKIVSTVRKRVKNIPFTVKIRVGKDKNRINLFDTIKLMEDEGVEAIIVHARTRSMAYEDPARWEWIKQAKEKSRLPVIGNGDIFSGYAAQKMLEETGCDGVMIARGSLGNPFIFNDDTKTLDQIFENAKKHIELLMRDKGEYYGVRIARKHIMWYFMNYNFVDNFKSSIYKIDNGRSLINYLNEQQEYYKDKNENLFSESTNFELFKKRILYWILEGEN